MSSRLIHILNIVLVAKLTAIVVVALAAIPMVVSVKIFDRKPDMFEFVMWIIVFFVWLYPTIRPNVERLDDWFGGE